MSNNSTEITTINSFYREQAVQIINNDLKVSDLDFTDLAEMIALSWSGQSTQLHMSHILTSFTELHKMYVGLLQNHLEIMDRQCSLSRLDNKACMTFSNPVMFLYNSKISQWSTISHSNPGETLSLFQLRIMQEGSARPIEPDFILSLRENSQKSYSKLDIIEMYKYFDGTGARMSVIINDQNDKKIINPQVVELFKEEKGECTEIWKQALEVKSRECNQLKNTDAKQEIITCLNYMNSYSTDQFITYLSCREVFHYIKSNDSCVDLNDLYDGLSGALGDL